MRLPAYDVVGESGPTLVLLHAFPLSSRMWERLVPLLGGVRVVTIDLPGLGRSEPRGEPTMTAMALAVLAVLDRLEVGAVTVFGLSTGGYVALELARLAPERLTSLVLGSTTCRLIEPDVPDQRREVADELLERGSVVPVLDSARDGLGVTALAEQPDLLPFVTGIIEDSDPEGLAWAARAIASRSDTADVLRDFDRRVLLLFGAEDDGTPPERGAAMKISRTGSSDTRLVVLDGTGHLTALEQPARVAALLLEHLEHLEVP